MPPSSAWDTAMGMDGDGPVKKVVEVVVEVVVIVVIIQVSFTFFRWPARSFSNENQNLSSKYLPEECFSSTTSSQDLWTTSCIFSFLSKSENSAELRITLDPSWELIFSL